MCEQVNIVPQEPNKNYEPQTQRHSTRLLIKMG